MGKVAFLFPGQGSQYVGMGRAMYDNGPGVREIFKAAEHITGKPIRRLCFDGPIEELTRTVNLQPSITTVNVSVLALLSETGVCPDFVAGHSLGEYSALYSAGVLSLEETIRLVDIRGEVMDQAAQERQGAMCAVLGLAVEDVASIVEGLQGGGVLGIANYNAPEQTVISGEKTLVDRAAKQVRENKGKAVPLRVSGAWHCSLMAGARRRFADRLEEVSFRKPKHPVLFNLTAEEEYEPDRIRDLMARQITESVFWFQAIEKMIQRGVNCFVEVGPKNVLSNLLKRIIPKGISYQVFQVDGPSSVEALAAEMESRI